ncbi:MAG: DUF4033 domain-containing protein [Acaryochloris sp. RU_4_1]|nr:DUF4033 domain-containing protein [Acaryochloris sp. SU_5_25]NJM65492.1 DUF4033 domain-containing protein [Acaryochloris sp. RU_4_1]NJR53423.1 DUF4033 domain-containing protein [Acaryochloris sp. CRU_2_0]
MKTDYKDNPIDRLFIWFFSRKMAEVAGNKSELAGYAGLVDLSKQIMQGRNSREQQEALAGVLRSLIPSYVLWAIRTLFSPSQRILEWNAWFASRLFTWLVGSCDLQAVEVVGENGQVRTQRSGLHIQKCRYLEESGCVGMCVNLCKLPTQEFFAQEFGFPLTLTPNFEDMSCEMVFGHPAPPLAEEPIYHQPCLVEACALAQPRTPVCPHLRDT